MDGLNSDGKSDPKNGLVRFISIGYLHFIRQT